MLNEQIPDDIRKQIESLNTKIQALDSLKGVARQEALTKTQKQLKRLQNLLNTYDFQIRSAETKNIASHQSQYRQFDLQIKRIQKTLENIRNAPQEDQLFKGRSISRKDTANGGANLNRQQLIELGHDTQQQGMDALNRVVKNVHVMDEQANQINLQLDRQINKLDSIYNDMNDTQTTLKRAQAHLRYFARSIYTDRLMICLIILIAIAIIVIIALSIAGKLPKNNTTVTKL